jgi:ATP-binding cassette subfamily B protein
MTFLRALLLPFRVTPAANALQILTKLVGLAITPVSVLLTAYFIDTALAAVRDGSGFSAVLPPIIALAAFQLYWYVTGPLLALLNKHMAIKTRLALRVPFVEKRARLEYKHIESNDTIDLINRVWNNPEGRLSGVAENMLAFIELVGRAVSYVVILLASAPLAGVVLIVLSVPIFYITMKGGKERYQAQRDMTKRDRMVWALSNYLTSRDTAAERSMFGYTDYLNKKYIESYEASFKYTTGVSVKWFIRGKASAVIMGLLSAAAMFILVPSVIGGSLSVGLFISLIGSLFGIINWIGWGLPQHFQQFAEQREYLKDLNQFLELSETKEADALPSAVPVDFDSLEFKNVSFTYPGTEKKILDGCSFKIEKGRHYSFVGVNGAGKTTVTKLLTRLYDDYEGEILLNGVNLREYPLAQVKAAFCAVFQDFARYDITVAENVAIGKANGATVEEIDNAIRLSGFSEKVAAVKEGRDTPLGKTRDDGVDLSGGEWQRVAFARAIISPAPVKILDEPTAALDPVAESQVYAQFEEISRGVTTLFISHRLASAKMADIIYVLENGKITESGSHDELMQAAGTYAEMFESQRSWYL